MAGNPASRENKLSRRFDIEQIRQCRRQFEAFDLNGDGVISCSELYLISRALGYGYTREQIKVSFKHCNCRACPDSTFTRPNSFICTALFTISYICYLS